MVGGTWRGYVNIYIGHVNVYIGCVAWHLWVCKHLHRVCKHLHSACKCLHRVGSFYDFKKNMKAFTDELVKGSNVMKGLNENIEKLTATTAKAYETVKSVAETRDRMRQHADTLEKAGYGSTEEGRQSIALAREKQYEAQSQLNKGSDLYESIRSKHGDKVADDYFAEFGASKSKRTLAQKFKDPGMLAPGLVCLVLA